MNNYHDIFDISTTDTTYYDNILKGIRVKESDIPITFELVDMSPDQYLNECCKLHNCTIEQLYTAISEKNLEELMEWNLNNKLPLPILDEVVNGQEGRHRAVLAKRKGYTVMPVMIIKPA